MDDIDNWSNGEYKGDNAKLVKQTESILQDVFEWIDDEMPGDRELCFK